MDAVSPGYSAAPREFAGCRLKRSEARMRVRRKPVVSEGRSRCDRCGGRRVLVVGDSIMPCPSCNDHETNAARGLNGADRKVVNFGAVLARRAA